MDSKKSIAENVAILLSEGLFLIPADEQTKVPKIKWRDLRVRFGEQELFDLMGNHDTNAVAIVLGEKSERLLCLDVDVKQKAGFDAELFLRMKEFYPELWERFRIEKTPSGGYHIFYRIFRENAGGEVKEMPASCNLASRYSTDEELAADTKKAKQKTRCFLELKAEGGLTQTFPSPGYTIVRGCEIPLISWEDHCSILGLCRSFDEVVKEVIVKTGTEESDFYSENPFDHFDGSFEGEMVLKDAGWELIRSDSKYDYYSKPGKKDKGVSATFNNSIRKYKVWTAGTDILPIAYTPSGLRAEIMFGGDKDKKKLLFRILVNEGFGKIKPAVEKRIVLAKAKYGGELPPNVSEEGRKGFEEEKAKLGEKYPYGIFWEEDTLQIKRIEVVSVAHALGFRTHNGRICCIDGFKIKYVEQNYLYNNIKSYIKEDGTDVLNSYENFLQNSGKFTITRLEELDMNLVLRSSKYVSYKFFANCYLKITSEGHEILEYSELDKLIWEEMMQKRDFKLANEPKIGIYQDYLEKAIGVSTYLKKCIGFYAHDYRDEEGYMIITTEQCENPKDGGGSGKNIFWNLLSLTTTIKSIPAVQSNKNDKLLAGWNGERVFVLSDLPKGFDLEFFKDIITGNSVVRKLYINEFSVSIEDMCKIGASTNFSFDDNLPGIKRRIRPIEFTDFFTHAGGVKKVYGKMFPKDWEENDYTEFDNFIIDCIKVFLESNCEIEKEEITKSGWKKQFDQKYSHIHQFIEENIDNWCKREKINNEEFGRGYELFCKENTISKKYTSNSINKALTDYCEHYGILFSHREVWKDNSFNVRGRSFRIIYAAPAPLEDDVDWDKNPIF